jgi:hypothetical protein
METYIIRIYRGEKDNPRTFVGIVEEVGGEGKRAFTNMDDLWEILNPKKMDSSGSKMIDRMRENRRRE